jgi:delta24-sterol reductase
MCISKVKTAIADFITDHRSWFVVVIVLPLSLVFDAFFAVRSWVIHKFFSAPKLHAQRVQGVQRQLRAWAEKKDGTKLCTARGGWQSISPGYRNYKKLSTQISINMFDILSFSDEERTVTVEPMVTMGQISHFLTPKGYTLPVLPEMDDLTVGGLYMGVGIETSSHKYGLFNDSVVSAEVALSSGEVITCSREENSDLFDALPWSYGTLGFLMSVKIRVVPCQPFVRVEYIPCKDQKTGVAEFTKHSQNCEGKDAPDFVEALAYSQDTMVVMPAYFASKEEAMRKGNTHNTLSWWYKPWFYKHVESMLHDNKGVRTEYIPLRDYYHRHTKSIFWELEQIIPVGNHWLFRWLLGWAVPPKVSFLKLTQTEALRKLYEEQHVIQDMLVPISSLSPALDCFQEHYDLYPLWICPYRAYDYGTGTDSASKSGHRCFLRRPQADSKDSKSQMEYEMFVDLGAYGIPRAVLEKKPFNALEKGHAVEQFVLQERGFQMLYADSYLSRDDFHAMFDHTHYHKMKAVYDPSSGFPVVFEKVCKKAASIWAARKKAGEDAKKQQ